MPASFRCAQAAEARGEPLHGTASFVRRWLLLEQPGSWGADALTQSKLPVAAAEELRRMARAAGTRIILIRRGVRLSGDRRQCYFLRTEQGNNYQAAMKLDSVDDLLDVDLRPLRDGGEIAEAKAHPAPVFLVCTHGKHDACCSVRGNQVSRVVCSTRWDSWECSHIGGDRFAANLVCFPRGLYYGRVRPDNVEQLIDDYRDGRISLQHFRGFCTHPFAVQAAEYFARTSVQADGLDGVKVMRWAQTGEQVKVTFDAGPGGRVDVEVRVSESEPYRLTCAIEREIPIPRYELVSCKVTPSTSAL